MVNDTISTLLGLLVRFGTPDNVKYVKDELGVEVKDKPGNNIVDKLVGGEIPIEEAIEFFRERSRNSDPLVLLEEYADDKIHILQRLALVVAIISQTPGFKPLNIKPQVTWGEEEYLAFREFLTAHCFKLGKGATKMNAYADFISAIPFPDEVKEEF